MSGINVRGGGWGRALADRDNVSGDGGDEELAEGGGQRQPHHLLHQQLLQRRYHAGNHPRRLQLGREAQPVQQNEVKASQHPQPCNSVHPICRRRREQQAQLVAPPVLPRQQPLPQPPQPRLGNV
eukprot:CAMPEP_0172192744 /NCGR_PEP_ID=MMETSP1050-20130122/24522_1 /TAXON_ID=233186 /ORGANISM="Cryptomonas curvata, Strain CCAP979/52" /LENGTH=124 /DNA_ID=CAMNT_0012868129 /DNA_START=270 /DNA_END=641 /DNA_ORIENTATION=+